MLRKILLVLLLIPLASANIINNSGFEDGTSNWTLYANGSWTTITPGYEGTKTARVTLDGTGTTDTLDQFSFKLYADTYYNFTITMNSTAGHNIDINMYRFTSPYTNYGLDWDNIDVTSTLTTYTKIFKTSGFSGTTTDTRLSLYMKNYAAASEKYYFDSISLDRIYTPNAPVSLTYTSGNFWINHTWNNNTGNITDAYNVTQNGTWTNWTNGSKYFNASLAAHGWSNISVYAFNATGHTMLNTTPINANIQLANNPVTLSNISASYSRSIGQLLEIKPVITDLDSDTIIYGSDATKGTFVSANGSLDWTPAPGDNGVYNWYINATDNNGSTDTFSFSVSVESNTPGAPSNIENTTGNYWINTSWVSGANTDFFNVSVNGTWTNGSSLPYTNNTISIHGWNNITVIAYNTTSTETSTLTNMSTQLPNNLPTLESSSISTVSLSTSQTLTVSLVNITDHDNDTITDVWVGISYVGFETNYTATQTAGTNNWTYDFNVGVIGFYEVTAVYAWDNQTQYPNSSKTTTSHSFEVTTAPSPISVSPGGGATTIIQQTVSPNQTYIPAPTRTPAVNIKTLVNDPTGKTILEILILFGAYLIIKGLTSTHAGGLVAGIVIFSVALYTRGWL